MFLVDKLAKPLSSRINLNALTGTFSEGLQAFVENVAQKDKILTALDHSTNNIVAGGIAPIITNINCLQWDASAEVVKINTANGVDLTTNSRTLFGACTISATFKLDSSLGGGGARVIHSLGAAAYRLLVDGSGNFKIGSDDTGLDVVADKWYKSTIVYTADADVTSFTLENITDGTTQSIGSLSINTSNSSHGGTHGFNIGARQNGANWRGQISRVTVSGSSVANFDLPLAEGSGNTCYDVSGNNGRGTITGASWVTSTCPSSWNHKYGHDLVGVLNGTVSGFDTGIGGDELDMYEIKMQSTSDAGDNGNSYFVENSTSNPTLFMSDTTEGSGKRMQFRVPNGSTENMSGISSADFNVYKVDYTDTSAVKVFVNGVLTLTASQTVTPTTAHYHIGNDNSTNASDNGFFHYFKGFKDGVLKIHAVVDSTGRVKDLISGNLLTADVGGTGTLGVRRFPAFINKTKQVATFDGVDDEIQFGSDTKAIPSADTITVVFKPNDHGTSRGCLYSQGSLPAGQGFSLVYNGDGNKISTRAAINSGDYKDFHTSTNSCIANGTTYKVVLTYDTSAGTASISLFNNDTDTLIETVTESDYTAHIDTSVLRKIRVGEDQNNLDDYNGTMLSIKSATVDVDFQTKSNIGTTTVTNNGSGDNGTVSTGSTVLFWGRRVVDSNGSIVSSDYANGNLTFNNKSGYVHNDSEVAIIINTTGSTGLTKTKAQLDSHSNGTDKLYVSKTGKNIKRLVQYDTASTTLTTTEQANNERFFS